MENLKNFYITFGGIKNGRFIAADPDSFMKEFTFSYCWSGYEWSNKEKTCGYLIDDKRGLRLEFYLRTGEIDNASES